MCEHLFKIFFFYFFLVLIKPSCLSCFYIGVMLASKFNYETRVNAFSDELICYAFVKNTFKRSRQAQSLWSMWIKTLDLGLMKRLLLALFFQKVRILVIGVHHPQDTFQMSCTRWPEMGHSPVSTARVNSFQKAWIRYVCDLLKLKILQVRLIYKVLLFQEGYGITRTEKEALENMICKWRLK